MFKKIPVAAIAVFYVIAVAVRYLATKTALPAYINNAFLETLFRGVGPALGAIVVAVVFKIKIPLTIKGRFSNVLIPFVLYWLVPFVILISASLFTRKGNAYLTVLGILIYTLLEETGWRGFLRPALKPLPKFTNILIVTVLWFIWHLDIAFTAGHLLFFVILFMGSWGIGIVADKTGSLLAVAAFHSLNNIYAASDAKDNHVLIVLGTLFAIWLTSVLLIDKMVKQNPENKPLIN